eukprot:g2521.t1
MSLRTMRDVVDRKPAVARKNNNNADADRWRTMSLSTVNRDVKRTTLFGAKPKAINVTSDIPGATVKPLYRFANKGKIQDIVGSKPSVPKQFRKDLRGRKTNDVSDIRGAARATPRFGSAVGRTTNPLNPTYNLPKSEPIPVPKPKFLGERMMDVSDIEGTKPHKLYKWKTRASGGVADIEGAQADWRPSHKQRKGKPRDIMRVADIIGEGRFRTSRRTDPLDPVHTIHGRTVSADAQHSKPRRLPKKRNGPNLHGTRDIPGAFPGWVPEIRKRFPRNQVRPTNRTDDIDGAGADSHAYGLRSARRSNPLDPKYVGVDGSELGSVKRPNTPPISKSIFHREVGRQVLEDATKRLHPTEGDASSRGGGSGGAREGRERAPRVSFAEKRERKRAEEEREMVRALK